MRTHVRDKDFDDSLSEIVFCGLGQIAVMGHDDQKLWDFSCRHELITHLFDAQALPLVISKTLSMKQIQNGKTTLGKLIITGRCIDAVFQRQP